MLVPLVVWEMASVGLGGTGRDQFVQRCDADQKKTRAKATDLANAIIDLQFFLAR
jgi:hypothetical protein